MQSLQGSRILVTGGCGFIGSAVCRYAIKRTGATILNVDALTYAANIANVAGIASDPRYHFLQADIADAPRMQAVFADFRPNFVMHLAAESHVDRSIDNSAAFVRTNIMGTHVLLEAARASLARLPPHEQRSYRFLHVSTDEVYGSLGPEGAFNEASPYAPRSPYSASKAAADHLVAAWIETYGFPALISNCSNNYGPYHFPEKLIPLTILNALDGKPLPIYGDGGNVRDWLFVEDHAEALFQVLARGAVGEKYLIGGRSEKTNLEVAYAICDTLDALRPVHEPRRGLVAFVPDRPGHDRRYAVDCAKIERELGWRPRHNFSGGLEKTVRWYLDNEPWWRPIREKSYRGERLGLQS